MILWYDHLSFLPIKIQLRVSNASIQAEDVPSPHSKLVWEMPQPLSTMSLIPCTASVMGSILATVIIHWLGIASKGQLIPLIANWLRLKAMVSLMASPELWHTDGKLLTRIWPPSKFKLITQSYAQLGRVLQNEWNFPIICLKDSPTLPYFDVRSVSTLPCRDKKSETNPHKAYKES